MKKLVPPVIFNFFAWALRFSDDPEESKYVNLEDDHSLKLFSVCQDLLHIFSSGRTQTPKLLALAMALRQISGCSNLITLLNGFGHCVSLSSTRVVQGYFRDAFTEKRDFKKIFFVIRDT